MPLDMSLNDRVKPEPPTPEELAWAAKLLPGDYEIYSEKLNMICVEAREIFARMGVSALIHAGDMVVAMYSAQGDQITAVAGTFLHSVTGIVPIKFILKHWLTNESVGVREGDIFYCNDAHYGGVHNADQLAIMPVFFEGELIAWTVGAAHQTETGATEPGGMPVSARSRYDEGMSLSPIKIAQNYRMKDDLVEMCANMISRAPRMQVLDMKARAAAADRMRVRLQELARAKGAGFLKGLFRRMLQHTEEATRARIASWNDGDYRHVVFTDTTGLRDALGRIYLTTRKRGDQLVFDFTGTSPENEGSYHAFLHVVRAAAACYFYQHPFHDFPISSGLYAPMEFIAPQGCMLNASPEAAICNSPIILMNIWQPLCITFSKMMFDSPMRHLCTGYVNAAGSGGVMSGVNQWGVRQTDMLSYPLNSAGAGARHDMDGVDNYGFPYAPTGKGAEVEDCENEQGHLHLFQRRLRDYLGFGKYRGGIGLTAAYTPHLVPRIAYMNFAKESRFPAHSGLFGGYPCSTHPGIQVNGSNFHDKMARGDDDLPMNVMELMKERRLQGTYVVESKTRSVRVLEKDDVFVLVVHGGGGYGDVLERDPQAVVEDLRNGIISHRVAEQIFQVAYDHATLQVDEPATAERRRAARRERLRRALPYESFIAAWSTKKPRDEVLVVYGSWPDARPTREIIRM
ncbi:MAG: hydantoinase B/oxoprolinase family protein [Candidatus Tectomicrobia bacterium]|nr:hydantoinase B/oxoprolinase family protein [Candidatus Tectomicrobia bacterium]